MLVWYFSLLWTFIFLTFSHDTEFICYWKIGFESYEQYGDVTENRNLQSSFLFDILQHGLQNLTCMEIFKKHFLQITIHWTILLTMLCDTVSSLSRVSLLQMIVTSSLRKLIRNFPFAKFVFESCSLLHSCAKINIMGIRIILIRPFKLFLKIEYLLYFCWIFRSNFHQIRGFILCMF